MIEYLAITELRSIVGKIDSFNAKYINDKVKEGLKLTINKKVCDLGCEIEDIEVKIENNIFADNIENYNESSVANFSIYNKSGLFIIIILCIIAYIFGNVSLQSAYESTNNLLFYFFKILLKSLSDFYVCFMLSEVL